jgi:hypothetical protein
LFLNHQLKFHLPLFALHPLRPGVGFGHDEKKTARDVPAVGENGRPQRTRKHPVRKEPGRDSGRALAVSRELSPLAELIHTLVEESIRFQIAGMSAAILQGVPATTLDTDIWIDLPERQYVRVLAVCRRLNATVLARTVVSLRDDTLVNFLYRVDGLGDFHAETKKALRLQWFGMRVPVLPLASIIRSKEAVGREKDLAHLPLLKKIAQLAAGLKRRKRNLKPESGW